MDRRSRLDQHLNNLDGMVARAPLAVVVLMHNLFRNLYPTDPYIPFPEGEGPLVRLDRSIELGEALRLQFEAVGSYPNQVSYAGLPVSDVRDATGDVYSPLWEAYDQGSFVSEGVDILRDRLAGLPVSPSEFIKGSALDVGCGSGRFTAALSALGFSRVTGVDWNEAAFPDVAQVIKESSSDDVSFVKGDLLDLPWVDDTFDFVFSNGTAHHTGDTERALAEAMRVLRPGGFAWIYLYGAGGHFWHARRRMPKIMKRIPQQFTMEVLSLLGMPKTRFIFTDNWYVPIEDHTTDVDARETLKCLGAKHIWRVPETRSTDIPFPTDEETREMYGDGELRYLVKK